MADREAMLKYVRVLKRRPDLTQDEFKAYWLNEHSKLEDKVMESGWVRRIAASFTTGGAFGDEPPWDGMVELYFDSRADLEALTSSHIPEMMRQDEENFVDLSKEYVRAVMEEYTMGER